MQKHPLWLWGVLCFVGAAGSYLVMESLGIQPKDRAGKLGQGAAQLLAVLTGIVLIVLSFVRGGKKKKGKRRDDDEEDEAPKRSRRPRAREKE